MWRQLLGSPARRPRPTDLDTPEDLGRWRAARCLYLRRDHARPTAQYARARAVTPETFRR